MEPQSSGQQEMVLALHRIEMLEQHVARLAEGLLTLTAWLTQVPGCLGQHEYEPMRKIVQGEERMSSAPPTERDQ